MLFIWYSIYISSNKIHISIVIYEIFMAHANETHIYYLFKVYLIFNIKSIFLHLTKQIINYLITKLLILPKHIISYKKYFFNKDSLFILDIDFLFLKCINIRGIKTLKELFS